MKNVIQILNGPDFYWYASSLHVSPLGLLLIVGVLPLAFSAIRVLCLIIDMGVPYLALTWMGIPKKIVEKTIDIILKRHK